MKTLAESTRYDTPVLTTFVRSITVLNGNFQRSFVNKHFFRVVPKGRFPLQPYRTETYRIETYGISLFPITRVELMVSTQKKILRYDTIEVETSFKKT